MSEKEIMLEIEEIKRIDRTRFTSSELQAIQGLLDLYNKAQAKLTEYEKQLDLDYVEENYIRKDKLKEILEDIDNNKPIIAKNKLIKLLEEE